MDFDTIIAFGLALIPVLVVVFGLTMFLIAAKHKEDNDDERE